ncbi:DNA topoisomerase III (plasmid) [Yersinia pseudotuberculosis IP 31758]|uniref:DNA topoisomerase n=1 Tax=Yersinia pseudotuberculosis serotype O:1b (strain IP 31758) TaxID=349747 RepID=A0A0U1QT82_YERP3|nr:MULTISPECIES: DNA topoisomerase 3 [Yersinia pseudotuberculosis complex]ABS45591.1 DNA topoisomerase III [Yersinia pseudotuberculosis IP 31758]
MSDIKRLFIAEKPNVARAIAAELGITGKGNGYIKCGSDTITWCFGHMFEQAEPDEYTPDDVPRTPKGNKIWRENELPIIPEEWIIKPREDAESQLKVISGFLKEADLIVNAGDPDREGQLLVDELLEYYNCNLPVKRYWVSSQDSVAVKRGLADLKDNKQFYGYGVAALARGRCDWLIGMNLSRAYTLRAKRGGYAVLLSVGRVQTPVLSLVVGRDREIEAFKPIPFYKIKAAVKCNDSAFVTDWIAKEDQEGLDSEGRLVDRNIASKLADKLNEKTGEIKEYKKTPQKKLHPFGFSLSSLTVVASNKFGYSSADVLEICQSLYETHKLTSYPRSDCKFLPETQFADAHAVLSAIKHVNPDKADLVDAVDIKIKSRIWNDNEVSAHHAIIPTMHMGSADRLNVKEKNIYDLIVRSYLAQFYPVHEFLKTTVSIDIDTETFKAEGNTVTHAGWKSIYTESEEDDEKNAVQTFVVMKKGDTVTCLKSSLVDSKTKAPPRFNDGSLIAAMENIHKYVPDSELKKLLRDGDGIGTVATRPFIIEELKNKGYLELKGKQLISTTLGRSIIDIYPEVMKSAVLTALNERVFIDIQKEPSGIDDFLEKQIKFITDQVEKAGNGVAKVSGAKQVAKISTIHKCKSCGKGLVHRTGKKGLWWSCSGYPECNQSYPDAKGKPNYTKGKE